MMPMNLQQFKPVTIAEMYIDKNGRTAQYVGVIQCITCMPIYKNRSQEELRHDYYSTKWVRPSQPPATSASSSDRPKDVPKIIKTNRWYIRMKQLEAARLQRSSAPTKTALSNALTSVAPDCKSFLIDFIASHNERYAKSYVVLYEGTYCRRISGTKRRFVFIVYLQDGETQSIYQWCRNILGQSELAWCIDSRTVFWKSDIPSGDDSQLVNVLKTSTCFFQNVFVVNDATKTLGYHVEDFEFLSKLKQLSTELSEHTLGKYANIWNEALQTRNALLVLHNRIESGTKSSSVRQSMRDKLDESFAKAFSSLRERHRRSEIEYNDRQEEEAAVRKELDKEEMGTESIQLEKELDTKKVVLQSDSSAVDDKRVIQSLETKSKRHRKNETRKQSFLTQAGDDILKTVKTNLKFFIVREVFNYFV